MQAIITVLQLASLPFFVTIIWWTLRCFSKNQDRCARLHSCYKVFTGVLTFGGDLESLTHWDLNGTDASLSAVLVQLNRAEGAVTLVKVTGLWRGCQMDLGTVKISYVHTGLHCTVDTDIFWTCSLQRLHKALGCHSDIDFYSKVRSSPEERRRHFPSHHTDVDVVFTSVLAHFNSAGGGW